MNDKARKAMRAIDCLVGGILVTSALFKAASPTESVALLTVYGLPAWLSLLLIQLEVVLGVLLISGAAGCIGRTAALVSFLGFGCFSAYRALAGYESCGCFGAIKVHPWATFVFDLFVILLLSWNVRRSAIRSPGAGRRVALATVCYLLIGGIAWGLSYNFQPHTLASYEEVLPSVNGLVILKPENWGGKKWSIAKYLSPNLDVSKGHWTILLHHHDCPDCQAALPYYEQLAEQFQSASDSRRVVLIEIPPYGTAVQHGSAITARLSDNLEWFVQAPVEIQVSDGIVTDASRDLPSIGALRKQVDSTTTMQQPSANIALE